MTIYPGAITYWNAISGDDIVPTLIGRVHVTGIPWEQWCPLSYSCHLCGKELRGTPRGIWIYQVFQQSRLNLPNFCGLLPAGESWWGWHEAASLRLCRGPYQIRSQWLPSAPRMCSYWEVIILVKASVSSSAKKPSDAFLPTSQSCLED